MKTLLTFLCALTLLGCAGPKDPPPTSIAPLDSARVQAAQLNIKTDPELAGCEIKCSAQNAMLVINGAVPTEGASKRAEALAARTEGIHKIANHLKIVPVAGASPEGLIP